MPTIPSSAYYVYELCYPNGVPFYVGKGTRTRIFDHIKEAFRMCPCVKCVTIRSIWADAEEVRHKIVFESDDEEAAYRHEHSLILFYGQDKLSNGTVGRTFEPKPEVLNPRKRKFGQGSVYERPDGRWSGQYSLPGANGKRRRITVYGDSAKDVALKLKKVRSDLATGLLK